MCLDYTLSKKQADKIIQQARKRGYIQVWKVCRKEEINFRETATTGKTNIYSFFYKKGIRIAGEVYNNYEAGWYVYLSETAAQKDCNPDEEIKVCFGKPSWIKRLGGYIDIGRAGILYKLAFPDWDKGSMTVREFKEMCRCED